MKPYLHIRRAKRIEATLKKLDIEDDYEMVIEACMLALTHYYIAALHAEGVTLLDPPHSVSVDYFNTKPSLELQNATKTLSFIEEIRKPHLRGQIKNTNRDQSGHITMLTNTYTPQAPPYDHSVVDKCLKYFEEGKIKFINIIGDAAMQPEWLI